MTSEQTSRTVDRAPGGAAKFYTQPELLTVEEFGNQGLNLSEQSYAFSSAVRAVPITSVEIPTVQRHYPIIFTEVENPSLLAVVGVLDDQNLFVDESGQWEAGTYIPAYLRCYPFALVKHSEDQYAVAVDVAAPNIAEDAEQPFFEGKELAPVIQARVDHCARFDANLKQTAEFCRRLADLKLLTGQELAVEPDGKGDKQVVAKYIAVDLPKVRDLDADILRELHLDGTLAAIYAHRFSLDLWNNLLERRVRRNLAA
jgi:hypothetical protein